MRRGGATSTFAPTVLVVIKSSPLSCIVLSYPQEFSPDKVNKLVDKTVEFPPELRSINVGGTRVFFDQPPAI